MKAPRSYQAKTAESLTLASQAWFHDRLYAIDKRYRAAVDRSLEILGQRLDRVEEAAEAAKVAGKMPLKTRERLLRASRQVFAWFADRNAKLFEAALARHPEIVRPRHRPGSPAPCVLQAGPKKRTGRPPTYSPTNRAWFVEQVDAELRKHRHALSVAEAVRRVGERLGYRSLSSKKIEALRKLYYKP